MQAYQNNFSRKFKTAALAAALYATTAFGAADAASLYFPHVATNDGWQTEIGAVNASNQAVAGTLKGYGNDGQLVESRDASLPGHGRLQVNVADAFTKHANIGYMVFDSESNTVEGYTKFSQPGLYRAAIPATRDITTGDLNVTHIASNADWWTGISLVNTTDEAKNITITFNKSDGSTESRQIPLDPKQHYAFSPRSLFGEPRPDIESAVIKNAAGVIGLELFGSAGWGTQLDGIQLSDKASTTQYYPHVASAPKSPDWWTGVAAYNPSTEKVALTVKPYDASGKALQTSTKDIEGKKKYIGEVNGLNLPDDTEWFYTTSTAPLSGFELFGTTDGQQLGSYKSVGSGTSTEGVFAKIEKAGWTGIAFVNTKNSKANVMLTAYKDDGTQVATKALSLNPYQKVVNAAEALFDSDVSSATYIAFASDQAVAGFQLNGSADWTMLDGLPALYRDYANLTIRLDQNQWKTLVTGNQDRDGNGKLDLDDMANGMSSAVCNRMTISSPCRSSPNAATLKNNINGTVNGTLYVSFEGPNNKVEVGSEAAPPEDKGYFEQIPAAEMLKMLKVADKY